MADSKRPQILDLDENVKQTRGLDYKTFYGRNLQIFVKSWNV